MSFLRPKDETAPLERPLRALRPGQRAVHRGRRDRAAGGAADGPVLLARRQAFDDRPVVARTSGRLRHDGGAGAQRDQRYRGIRPPVQPRLGQRAALPPPAPAALARRQPSDRYGRRLRRQTAGNDPQRPALRAALAEYKAAPAAQKLQWSAAYAKPLEEYAAATEEKKTPPSTVAVDQSIGAVTVHAGGAGPVRR